MSVLSAKKTDKLKRFSKLNQSSNEKNEAKESKPIRLKFRESIKADPSKNCYIETDVQFINEIEQIAKPQQNVLAVLLDQSEKKKLTDLECDKIDFKARIHYKASIVNKSSDNQWGDIEEKHKCSCGCKRAKGEPLSLLASIKQMSILGSGVVLLFMFKKTLSFILLSGALIYAVFGIVTNLMGDSAKTVGQCSDLYCEYKIKASSQNKFEPHTFTVIQWWTGMGFCLVWIFMLRLIRYFGKTQDQSIDAYLNSSSDYAVMISNLPHGEYHEQDLAAYFDLLYEKAMKLTPEIVNQSQSDQSSANDGTVSQQSEQEKNKFNMKSIQVIYNMEFSRQIIQKVVALSMRLNSFYSVNEQTKQMTIKQTDIKEYKSIKQEICQLYELLSDLRKRFFNQDSFRKNLSTAVAIVEFHRPSDKDRFLKYFGNQKIGILKEVQQKIKSFFKKASKCVMFRGNVLKISRAPQPSDLIYKNCEKKSSISRFFLIWLMTFGIIIFSFGVITVLMFVQDYLSKESDKSNKNGEEDDLTISIFNILISIGLQIINKFLWGALFYILDIEYNYSLTQKIISQMNKVLIATCINIIALPIISNYVIRNNVYGTQGLAGMVFDYQISILGVGLITKLVEPALFIKRVLLYIRPIRNFIIRFMCEKLGDIDIEKGIPEINAFYEAGYFNIAESYVYVMAATYQAAFFCQLQPSLLVLVFLVVVCFYWVNKYKVLRKCNIPQITEIMVFETALSQAAIVPIIYGAGSIVITYIEASYNPSLPLSYTQGFIAVGIGFFGFFNPKDCLNKIAKLFMNKIVKRIREGADAEQSPSANNILQKGKQNDLSDQIDEPEVMTRLDNYFKSANSLPLVGFEHALASGQQIIFPDSSLKDLEIFCGKFVQNDDYKRKLHKKIKEVIADKICVEQSIITLEKGQLGRNARRSIQVGNLNVLTSQSRPNQEFVKSRKSKIVLPKLLGNIKP